MRSEVRRDEADFQNSLPIPSFSKENPPLSSAPPTLPNPRWRLIESSAEIPGSCSDRKDNRYRAYLMTTQYLSPSGRQLWSFNPSGSIICSRQIFMDRDIYQETEMPPAHSILSNPRPSLVLIDISETLDGCKITIRSSDLIL